MPKVAPARRPDHGNLQYMNSLLAETVECSEKLAFESSMNLLILMEACVKRSDAITIEITILLLIYLSPFEFNAGFGLAHMLAQ